MFSCTRISGNPVLYTLGGGFLLATLVFLAWRLLGSPLRRHVYQGEEMLDPSGV